MPSQIVAPIPVSPQRRGLPFSATAAPDFFSCLHANLAASTTKHGSSSSNSNISHADLAAFYAIPEDDYTVPAAPPPSPVSFRSDHWSPVSTANKNGVTPVCR